MRGRFGIEAKVGLFVLAGLVLLGYMSLRVGKLDLGPATGYDVWAVFPSVSGLKKGVGVEMAGIEIGRVKDIQLYKGQAKVIFTLQRGVKLPADSTVIVRTRGVLGDKFIDIVPGSSAAPRIKSGDQMVRVHTPSDMGRVLARIGEIAADIKAISTALKDSIATPQSQQAIKEALVNIASIAKSLNQTIQHNQQKIDLIIANFKQFSGDLREITGDNKQAIKAIIASISRTSRSLEVTMRSLRQVALKLDSGRGSLGRLINEDTTVTRLNATLKSLKGIVAKINRGEGSLGKLVNDETTVNRLNDALSSINNYLARSDRWRFSVEYTNEYMVRQGDSRSTINLTIQPKPDKYYILGLVSAPMGRITTTDTTYEYTGAMAGRNYTEKKTTRERNQLLVNAQIGKRFYDVRLRGGLFQSTGGVGVDYYLFNDRASITFEAFDFDPDRQPHLRAFATVRFFKHLYVTAGVDDFASNTGNSSFFVGAGLKFDDDDLKYLLTSVPVPKQ